MNRPVSPGQSRVSVDQLLASWSRRQKVYRKIQVMNHDNQNSSTLLALRTSTIRFRLFQWERYRSPSSCPPPSPTPPKTRYLQPPSSPKPPRLPQPIPPQQIPLLSPRPPHPNQTPKTAPTSSAPLHRNTPMRSTPPSSNPATTQLQRQTSSTAPFPPQPLTSIPATPTSGPSASPLSPCASSRAAYGD